MSRLAGPAKDVRRVLPIRISPYELAIVSRAAGKAGESVSAFIRSAALEKAVSPSSRAKRARAK